MDLDGDEDLDMVSLVSIDGGIAAVDRNDGSGRWTQQPFAAFQGNNAAWADFVGDGDADMVLFGGATGRCRILRNDSGVDGLKFTNLLVPALSTIGNTWAAWGDFEVGGHDIRWLPNGAEWPRR